MEYLNYELFGNSIHHWVIALGVLVGSFVLVKIIYWVFSSVFKNLTNKISGPKGLVFSHNADSTQFNMIINNSDTEKQTWTKNKTN